MLPCKKSLCEEFLGAAACEPSFLVIFIFLAFLSLGILIKRFLIKKLCAWRKLKYMQLNFIDVFLLYLISRCETS